MRSKLNVFPLAYMLGNDLYIYLVIIFHQWPWWGISIFFGECQVKCIRYASVCVTFISCCMDKSEDLWEMLSLYDTVALQEHLHNYSSQPRYNELLFITWFNLPSSWNRWKEREKLLKMQIMWTSVTQVNQTLQSACQGDVNLSAAARSPDSKEVLIFWVSSMQKLRTHF